MPKMKTHSGAKKRFKVTGKGKVKARSAHLNHILAKQPSKTKRHRGMANYLADVDVPRMKRLLVSE